jgi:selenide,water dikinase
VLRHLPPVVDPRVLVGAATADDAAVYRLGDDVALVATLDFITPVVEDPEAFGAVAAANAISDVFAMGARPILALNVVGFPRDKLPLSYLERILRGGAAKAGEAGVPVVGGHSVDDPEIKYGMVVLGTVHPDRVVTNAGARAGDLLVLTKPLGIGIITTAIKAQKADDDAIATALEVMTTLNRAAADVMIDVGVHAATDVTGFGLLGHLAEMVRASGLAAHVRASGVPILPAARSLAEQGTIPGGTRRNLEAVTETVEWATEVDELTRILLCDAQTSGGLLIAVPPERADALLAGLGDAKTLAASVIGELSEGPAIIRVSP